MRLISASSQFVRDMCHVCSPFTKRLVHLLQAFEIRMAVTTCAANDPSLWSQAIVKLQYDFKDIDQADTHLFSTRVEHTSEIEIAVSMLEKN